MKQLLAEAPTNYPLAFPPNVNCSVTACRLGVGWSADLGNCLFHTGWVDTSEAGRRWSFLLAFEEVQEGGAGCGHALWRHCTFMGLVWQRVMWHVWRDAGLFRNWQAAALVWVSASGYEADTSHLTGMVWNAGTGSDAAESGDPWPEGRLRVPTASCCRHCWFLTPAQPHRPLSVKKPRLVDTSREHEVQ